MPRWEKLQLTDEEILIINILKKEFPNIKPGEGFSIGTDNYYYVSAKPTEKYLNLFDLDRDIIIVFDLMSGHFCKSLNTHY